MPPKKKTEAQIARQKAKDAKKKQALKDQVKKDREEFGSVPGEQKAKEESIINPKLDQLKLQTVPTKSDGDCLFSSLLHQLHSIGGGEGSSFQDLAENKNKVNSPMAMRKVLTDFMKAAPENFGAFILAEDVGLSADDDENSQKKVNKYAEKMTKSSETWGGHLEIVAAASVFNVKINVVYDQPNPQEVLPVSASASASAGTSSSSMKTWTIVWWQQKFALGAHYEPTVPATTSSNSEQQAKKEDEKKESDDDDE